MKDKKTEALKLALADSALDRMAKNARELGLDYEPIIEKVEDSVGMGHKAWDMVDPKEIAKAFHEALNEPPCKTGSQCTNKCQQCEHPAQQQEPHGWYIDGYGAVLGASEPKSVRPGEWLPFYISPQPSKPWVWLTEKDKLEARNSVSYSPLAMTMGEWAEAVQNATEAKLQEKNT